MKKINLLVAAGGTGGHLFPAMAVVEELRQMEGIELNPVFVGNSGRIEGKAVPASGYQFYDIPMIGFQGKISLRNFQIPFRLLKSINICKKIISDYNINIVLCTGAYLSYPAGIAAGSRDLPLVLMESNVIPGKSIKALSTRSKLIITSFEESFNYINPGTETIIKNLGNPVRKQLNKLPSREEALKGLKLDTAKKTLLVLGGSLGAKSINQSVDKLLDSGMSDKYNIIWQTGVNYKPAHKESDSLKIFTFIDDMASAYSAADLVLARSGATTLAELAVTAKPSLLVPYPNAANNHQEYNADNFEKHGAAFKIQDNQLWDRIEHIVPELMENNEKLAEFSSAARMLAKTEAALRTALEIVKLCK